MKQMLTPPTGTHFSARLLRSTVVLLTGVALGFALWTATAPTSVAQEHVAHARSIQANLPAGKTMANATKAAIAFRSLRRDPQKSEPGSANRAKRRGGAPRMECGRSPERF